MSKKIKIILSSIVLALAIGYVGLYHWTKSRFIDLYQEMKQDAQAEGFVIEESPLVFSGFPFRLTATQEKSKVTKIQGDNTFVMEGSNSKVHVSIFNPFKYNFEGNVTLSVLSQGRTALKITLPSGSIAMGYKNEKLKPVLLRLNDTKLEIFGPAGIPEFTVTTKEIGYESADYKITDMDHEKILSNGDTVFLKDLVVVATKGGISAPVFQLKNLKINAKQRLPLTVMETLESILKNPTNSPMAKICQDGGKVPPLKSTVELMEKVDSYIKLNAEVAHDNYVIDLDIDGKINKSNFELQITLQVDNLNNLFDAFNFDPTMRLIAHGFIKKESDKSEKAKIVAKLSEGTLYLNDMAITKLPPMDWDHLVLPADVCSRYASVPPR